MMDANKKFACDICGKSFQQKVHMTDHRRIHTGGKLYECAFRNNTFSDISVLAKHTGERPYECETSKLINLI